MLKKTLALRHWIQECN